MANMKTRLSSWHLQTSISKSSDGTLNEQQIKLMYVAYVRSIFIYMTAGKMRPQLFTPSK